MSVAPARLRDLARKYETLACLRVDRAAGGEVPSAKVFRALAREFPGCLNELDTLPLDDIRARALALALAAADGGAVEPWMEWLSGYHALLAAALWLKPRLAKGAELGDARAEELARQATRDDAASVDASFVRAVAAPPGGRLVALVLDRLASAHGVPAAVIKRALFPKSRRLG